jgi:two-component system, cell cycle response regulator CpdR
MIDGSMRILYVEDNDLVREVTLELLAADGRELIPAGTAEDALAEYHARPCDIVITDVSLPVMSGLDLAKSLLQLNPALPIIIASGYSLDFGVENFGPNVRAIIKPFDSLVIESLISDLVKTRI